MAKLAIQENSVAIVGWDEGGPGQTQAWLESHELYHVACFVQPDDTPPQIDIETERPKRDACQFDFPTPSSFKGKPLLSSSHWAELLREQGLRQVIVMTADRQLRKAHLAQAEQAGLETPSIVHPTATIMDDALIADGVVIYANSFIGYRAELERGVLVNSSCSIDHHNVIRSCATLDPGVTTAGAVTIGECAQIHTSATIINRVRIGARAIVGAGAVVIRDVPEGVTVAGVPARVIKENRVDEAT